MNISPGDVIVLHKGVRVGIQIIALPTFDDNHVWSESFQSDEQSVFPLVFQFVSSASTICTHKVAVNFLDQKGIGQVGVENVVSSITSRTPEELFLPA